MDPSNAFEHKTRNSSKISMTPNRQHTMLSSFHSRIVFHVPMQCHRLNQALPRQLFCREQIFPQNLQVVQILLVPLFPSTSLLPCMSTLSILHQGSLVVALNASESEKRDEKVSIFGLSSLRDDMWSSRHCSKNNNKVGFNCTQYEPLNFFLGLSPTKG